MISPIVGAHFRHAEGTPAKLILAELPGGTKLVLRRQFDNPYDANAVKVLVQRTAFPGMLDREDELAEGRPLSMSVQSSEWWENFGEALAGFGQDLEEFRAIPEHHLGYIPAVEALPLAPRMDAFLSANPESSWQWVGALTYTARGAPAIEWELPAVEALSED